MEFPFPSFQEPPIAEVAIGLEFEKLDRLSIPHFGLFWDQIRAQFPEVQHASPFFGPAFAPDKATGLPLPRIWFIDQTQSKLLQLQTNRITFNWRRREGIAYPRYGEISNEFFELLNRFELFLAKHDVGVMKLVSAELAYINILAKNPAATATEMASQLLKDFHWENDKNRFLSAPKTISWSAMFPLPENNGELIAKFDEAKLGEESATVLKLELAARHTLPPSSKTSDVNIWFGVAREWIVKGFVDLTSASAQNDLWSRKE